MENLWFAFGLTLFAGLSTGIGSLIAFAAKRDNYRFLSVSTGFSAGVMLFVSFVEIFYKGSFELSEAYGPKLGPWVNSAAFFGGILFIALIDNLIPGEDNPHETHSEAEAAPLHDPRAHVLTAAECRRDTACGVPGAHEHVKKGSLLRVGLFTALAITIHNLPEGLATFLAALKDPSLGVAIAIAIALHNIPEGVSVSVPIFYATGDRRKAFIYSFLSGLAEPVGAVLAWLGILAVFGSGGTVPPQVNGILFAGVAGIMVYISLDELLPASRAYGKGHDSIFGLFTGMLVMSLSLLLIKGT